MIWKKKSMLNIRFELLIFKKSNRFCVTDLALFFFRNIYRETEMDTYEMVYVFFSVIFLFFFFFLLF